MNEIEARRIEAALVNTPCNLWRTRQAIVLDWNDGPREGLCALSNPGCEFHFELHTEKHAAADLDDRLYLISFLKTGSVDRVLEALNQLGEPTRPVWTPIWRFDPSRGRINAEKVLDGIVKSKRPTGLIVRSNDMQHFTDCLDISRNIKKFLTWFEYKGHTAESVVSK